MGTSAFGLQFHCDSDLDFDRPELDALRTVWRASATRTALPRRTDFDGPALESALQQSAIMERVSSSNGVSRYRVAYAGSSITALMGDQTGRFIDEFVPPALMPRWIGLFDAVLGGGIPLRITTRFEFPDLAHTAGEMFIAPLADDAGKPNLVIVGLYMRPRELAVVGGTSAESEQTTPENSTAS
jgi:hypothetical protein